MAGNECSTARRGSRFPQVLRRREQASLVNRFLERCPETILPVAMRESQLDTWLVLRQEDDLDPGFRTMTPMDTWCSILQMLVFCDHGEEKGIEWMNISGTDSHDLYGRPHGEQLEEKQ